MPPDPPRATAFGGRLSEPPFVKSWIRPSFEFYSCKVVSPSDTGMNKALSFDRSASITALVFKLRNYFMQVVSKCSHLVMSYMKQNKKHIKQTLESAQYGLEIIFNFELRSIPTQNSTHFSST